ncbi:zinc transporter ZntB [Pseudahrensia aquimaris]|uniref:Zinc transporter ZntB n=1 Tax=Pseudahrensia aquimaris TaxID=744461 RepID=A0ABW3FGN6_9HYPH
MSEPKTSADGLVFGCVLDGQGGAQTIGWPDADIWKDDQKPCWLHLEAGHAETEAWLRESSGLAPLTIDALLARETRPRYTINSDRVWAILRGVNLNSNAQPDDMVAMRIWSDGKRIITMRNRRLQTPRDILARLTESADGPRTIGQLYQSLVSMLVIRMADTINALDDALSGLEIALEGGNARAVRGELADLRLRAVNLRRYLAPQREALAAMANDAPDWLSEIERQHLTETADRLTRYVEEIDAARERALVLKDDATNQIAERSERTLYLLSIISAIFLPLSFLTGLLGMNVGGLPGLESASAFLWVCVGMGLLLAVQLIVMRWLKWL